MVKDKGIEVESIESILEKALEQQKTGLLRIECTQDGRLREGELYLLSGQVTYARAEMLTGQEAFISLLNWRKIHFVFATEVARPPANVFARFKVESAVAPTYNSLAKTPVAAQQRQNATVAKVSERERRTPQKLGEQQEGLSRPLTRRQRLVYFLVNGERTVDDLARTTGKTMNEVELILRELEAQRLVAH